MFRLVHDPLSLTPRQEAILVYLRWHWLTFYCPPTYRQLCCYFNMASPNAALGHLKALAKKGRIRWQRERSGRFGRLAIPVDLRIVIVECDQ